MSLASLNSTTFESFSPAWSTRGSKAELHQLGQNLEELGDVDLNDLHQLIDYYDTFWLEEKNLEEKRLAYLRAPRTAS